MILDDSFRFLTFAPGDRPFPDEGEVIALGPDFAVLVAELGSIHERKSDMETAVVPVKSAWASTVNYAAWTSIVVGLANSFNLPVDATSVNTILAAAPVVIGVFTWVKNTWFSHRVLAASIPAK